MNNTFTPAQPGWSVVVTKLDVNDTPRHVVCPVIGWALDPDESDDEYGPAWEPVIFDPDDSARTLTGWQRSMREAYPAFTWTLLTPGQELDEQEACERLQRQRERAEARERTATPRTEAERQSTSHGAHLDRG